MVPMSHLLCSARKFYSLVKYVRKMDINVRRGAPKLKSKDYRWLTHVICSMMIRKKNMD